MKYNLGDKVWWAWGTRKEEWVQCPECFGLKYLTVILGNQSEVTIECEGCKRGYLGSLGNVSYWKQTAEAKLVTINRIEINRDGETEYGTTESYCVKENDLFSVGERELAEIRALELTNQHNIEEENKIKNKVKQSRSWSWHVHYHRERIRTAEKDIEYHKKCLAYAKTLSKEVS